MKDIVDIFEGNEEEINEIELDRIDVESEGSNVDIFNDYSFVREKLIKSIVRGSEIIDEATRETKTAPSPRAIEAASGAVKTLTDVSKALIDLHEKIRNIERPKINPEESITENDEAILKTTLSDLLSKIDEI